MDTADGFEGVFVQYHDRLVRYLGRLVGDPALGQDLAQETLVRVHTAGEQLRNPEARTVWIYRIASNLAMDHLRQRRGGDAQWRAVAAAEDLGDGGEDGVPCTENRSAEERLEEQEMAECLRLYLHELPPSLRACLVLRDVEGLGEKAAAEILGCSVAAVKVRTHRARTKLRERFHQRCDFYRDARGVLRCTPIETPADVHVP